MSKTRSKPLALLIFVLILLTACTPTPRLDNRETGKLHFEPEQLPNGQINQLYAVTITITGGSTPVGDISLEEGNFPESLFIEKIKGEDKAILSGTPTTPGTYQFTIAAWCFGTNREGDQGSKNYMIVVTP